jgi:hypothetical protein
MVFDDRLFNLSLLLLKYLFSGPHIYDDDAMLQLWNLYIQSRDKKKIPELITQEDFELLYEAASVEADCSDKVAEITQLIVLKGLRPNVVFFNSEQITTMLEWVFCTISGQ